MRSFAIAMMATLICAPVCAPALAQNDADRLIAECDRLTGHPLSPAPQIRGPVFDRIDAKAALPACLAAAKAAADNGRIIYQLGRALRANRKYEDARNAISLLCRSEDRAHRARSSG
jgi:hypothetical protein